MKSARFAASLAVLLLSACAGAATAGENDLYEAGKRALSAGRYSESIRLLEGAALDHSLDHLNELELHYWLGYAHWKRGEGDRAMTAYHRVLELDPEGESDWSLYALENLAEVATRTDRLQESRRAYEAALQRERRPEWITKIENQLTELDLTEGVFVPDENTLYNEVGEVIGGVGPSLMRTNRNFEIARHTNDPEKEARYYRLAADTDPGMFQAPFNLALALVRQGRFAEALPWLERSDRIWKADTLNNPRGLDKADAHAFLALAHLELGDRDRAAHHAHRALAVDGGYFWTQLYAQRVKIVQGSAREALPVLQTLLKDNPEEPELLFALSRAQAAVGRSGDSRKTLAESIDLIGVEHPWMGRLSESWSQLLSRETPVALDTIEDLRSEAPGAD